MSFIVKGAEAPKTCMDCPLADVEQGWCASEMVTIIDFDERPVECPLVALPNKHGRLVDADALIEKYWDGNSMTITAWDLKDIKTVIEAEDES